MHTIKSLIFLAVVVIPYLSADCYKGGGTWGTASEISQIQGKFPAICRILSGNYLPGMTAQDCGKSGNVKHDFYVRHEGTRTERLTNKQCKQALSPLLNRCERGGTITVGPWVLRAIPSTGTCGYLPGNTYHD